jgi:hypothetical protein
MQKDEFKFIALDEAKLLLGDSHMTDEQFGRALVENGPRFASISAELAMLLKFEEA